jgi:hypothetical protein
MLGAADETENATGGGVESVDNVARGIRAGKCAVLRKAGDEAERTRGRSFYDECAGVSRANDVVYYDLPREPDGLVGGIATLGGIVDLNGCIDGFDQTAGGSRGTPALGPGRASCQRFGSGDGRRRNNPGGEMVLHPYLSIASEIIQWVRVLVRPFCEGTRRDFANHTCHRPLSQFPL